MATRLGVTPQMIGKWRARCCAKRVDGLLDEPRPGAPRTVRDADVERVVTLTLETTPRNATHWSTRTLAARCGLSRATVHRIWCAFALQPHRTATFKLSTDPLFIDKVRGIVGLYLHPPDKALVLCADEQQIRRGTHRSPAQLEAAILRYIAEGNRHPSPFVWTKTADEILASVARFCQRISETPH